MEVYWTRNLFLATFFLIASSSNCFGYDVEVHEFLSDTAYTRSWIAGTSYRRPKLFVDWGLVKKRSDPEPKFPNEEFVSAPKKPGLSPPSQIKTGLKFLSIKDLIKFGSRNEDNLLLSTRVENHFYDPQNDGRALIAPIFFLSGPPGNWPSADWALEDHTSDLPFQYYSYNDAVRYFSEALTAPTKIERDKKWGVMFQSLGHVIHHIQDMAQPQHTRNDIHSPTNIDFRKFYERYTTRVFEDQGGLPNHSYVDLDLKYFTKARDFWDQGNRRGMAEISSYNFVSAGTNFNGEVTGNALHVKTHEDYDFPSVEDTVVLIPRTDIQSIPCEQDNRHCVPPNAHGDITFIETSFVDPNSDEIVTNSRASSYGIFNHDLTGYLLDKDFSLNRFNYDEAHKILLPRAVSYSTGLINYFFRGKLLLDTVQSGDNIRVRNFSNGDDAVNDDLTTFKEGGEFQVYYETDQGVRKVLPNLSNLTLSSDFQRLNHHEITGLIPAIQNVPDMGDEGRVFVVYDGLIGNERGIAASNIEKAHLVCDWELLIDEPFTWFWLNDETSLQKWGNDPRGILHFASGFKIDFTNATFENGDYNKDFGGWKIKASQRNDGNWGYVAIDYSDQTGQFFLDNGVDSSLCTEYKL